MSQHFVAFGAPDESPGKYLHQLRENCTSLLRPENHRTNVTACILDKFTELDKAMFASRQYILTLWPAFIGAIVALAPDCANMVYDNLWWAALFAVTCGGLPGLDKSSSPPHHVEARSEQEGRQMCEAWKRTSARPKLMSKTETMGNRTRGRSYIFLEWCCFAIGSALWLAFCIYFGLTLGPPIDFNYPHKVVRGAAWYYSSCSPAVALLILELMQNRIDLYEPSATTHFHQSLQIATGDKSAQAAAVSQPIRTYERVKTGNAMSLWLRIVRHQWCRTKYRILIRDQSTHWFFLLGRAAVGIGRVAIFAFGSTEMGDIILMPVPSDLYLFILLIFTTVVPRQFWSAFWTNGNRGADLVVFVNTLQLAGSDDD